LKVPQTRDGAFYPQSLEKGLRSERALRWQLGFSPVHLVRWALVLKSGKTRN
jgi:hypothetical protein